MKFKLAIVSLITVAGVSVGLTSESPKAHVTDWRLHKSVQDAVIHEQFDTLRLLKKQLDSSLKTTAMAITLLKDIK